MSKLQCIKFGEMAHQITTKVNPKDTSLNTYVGLEHLDTGSLRINRKGTPQDVIGEKLRVCKGDIIFGKRRVYQRKVAIADFDGICSAHAMVLRPKEDVVDKDFFPFFMQSDVFMERALQISVGSLSPTINWKTLAAQEFSIPTLPEQRRIATTLWAAEDCIVKGERFVSAAERAKQVLMRELFSKGIGHSEFKEMKGFGELPKEWIITPIIDYLTKIIDYRGKSPKKTKSGIPLITAKNIRDGFLLDEPREYIQNENYNSWMVRGIPEPGDVLFTTEAPLGNVAYVPKGKIALAQRVITLCPNEKLLDNKFLFQMLLFSPNKNRILSCQSGTTVTGIRQSVFRKILFAFPPLPEQRQIAGILTRCDETIAAARANVAAAKALKMKMINEMLGPEM